MRFSITKKHHQQLLLEVAAALKTDDPKDALEHILNCWIHPCSSQQSALVTGVATVPPTADGDIDLLVSWDGE